MEEKKTIWDDNPLRTVLGNRHFNINFFRKLSLSKLSSVDGAGFTLIEVLITIALIGVMAVGIIMALNPLAQIQKARDASRKSDLSQIQKALEAYYQDVGRYPDHVVSSSDYFIKTVDASDPTKEWGTSWQPYMSMLPKDPSTSKRYIYYSTGSGQTYYIYANLDRGGNDPQACFPVSGDPCFNAVANNVAVACGGKCNYGVSSPNVSP